MTVVLRHYERHEQTEGAIGSPLQPCGRTMMVSKTIARVQKPAYL